MNFKFLKKKGQSGYIALISIIIIVALMMIISVAVSFSGFFSRFGILENEYKEVSSGLAEACGDAAILKLAGDWAYLGNESITVGFNNCLIVSIQDSGPQKLIRVQGIYQKSYTNLEIRVSKDVLEEINIDSWKEVVNF